jgi:hypothetical protein
MSLNVAADHTLRGELTPTHPAKPTPGQAMYSVVVRESITPKPNPQAHTQSPTNTPRTDNPSTAPTRH